MQRRPAPATTATLAIILAIVMKPAEATGTVETGIMMTTMVTMRGVVEAATTITSKGVETGTTTTMISLKNTYRR
jgi:hypothetical protein